ncbi:MAG: TIGR00296 family protein [Candidatus Odinarchaeia archaeon]
MSLNFDDGVLLVKISRDAIKEYISTGKEIKPSANLPEILYEKRGVFVTLYIVKDGKHELRGCIGYPYPVLSLIDATIKAAISAATKDYRFYPPYGPGPVKLDELNKIVIEVSVLTKPELIKVNSPKDYLNEIEIGRDGLIIERGMFTGLLLPQVPVEQGWGVEEFLSYCCQKAGLMPDCWLDEQVKIYRFQAQIFAESEPNGEVKIKNINESTRSCQ